MAMPFNIRKFRKNDKEAYNDNKFNEIEQNQSITPLYVPIDEGTISVEKSARTATGVTYQIAPKEVKSQFKLLSYVWKIGSSFLKTSQSVVIGVADITSMRCQAK